MKSNRNKMKEIQNLLNIFLLPIYSIMIDIDSSYSKENSFKLTKLQYQIDKIKTNCNNNEIKKIFKQALNNKQFILEKETEHIVSIIVYQF